MIGGQLQVAAGAGVSLSPVSPCIIHTHTHTEARASAGHYPRARGGRRDELYEDEPRVTRVRSYTRAAGVCAVRTYLRDGGGRCACALAAPRDTVLRSSSSTFFWRLFAFAHLLPLFRYGRLWEIGVGMDLWLACT